MPNNGTPFSGPQAMASMMETAMKAQRQWMRSVLGDDDGDARVPPMFAEAATQWQDAVRDTINTWSGETTPIMQQTLERLTKGQSMLMRVFQLVTDAWQDAAERAGAGEDVEDVIEQYVERVDEQVRKATNVWSSTVQDQQAMWQQYVDELQSAGLPFSLMMNMPGLRPGTEDAADTPAQAMFESMYKLFEFETLSERLLDAPGLGLSREFNEKVAQGFKAFQEYQRASVRYRTITASIWQDAVQRFLHAIGSRVKEGKSIDSMRELTKLWTKIADQTFIEAFRTDDYIDAQNDFLEASLRLRKQQRIIGEEVQRTLDQPTRSEMEEIYQLLHRLRQENKMLKKELNAQQSADNESAETEALKAEMQEMAAEVQRFKTAMLESGNFDDLTAIKGIGAARQEELRSAGLLTYRQLADATPDAIRRALGTDLSDDRIRSWKDAAAELA